MTAQDFETGRVATLRGFVRKLCTEHDDRLPFHGWHHIAFVSAKGVEFALRNGADTEIVAAAALVHDLNYLVRKNSEPSAGESLRAHQLRRSGFTDQEIDRIEAVISESHTASRTCEISPEGAALSDADTLFKAVPITPVVLSHRYLAENDISLRQLARKIVDEQTPLVDEGIYFYDPDARARYLPWATANLNLWKSLLDSLDDPDVDELLRSVNVR
ncbi:hypothetical protein [Streptomyces sp. NPDC087300]|uniref:hypothetical protein n=1 Tax=Streptomyces sp. NPDC087300 TaxID=3365780 RepID=UPI0037F84F8A